MKQICIYCVNYNSYESVYNYLDSIETAVEGVCNEIELVVALADNTSPYQVIDYAPKQFTLRTVTTGENKGYFGAVRLLMDLVSPCDFDYSIISNVDVILDESFFKQLLSYQSEYNIGWIAPAILSQSHHFDFNPQARKRYSILKMKSLRLMFKYPILLKLKQRFLHQYRDIKDYPSGKIYAGHGSFIILTNEYFKRCGIINYPIFLYGEEIYLAETCRQHQLPVDYAPQIKVRDIGRVSTGRIPSREYCRLNYEAISYIIKTFYQTTN